MYLKSVHKAIVCCYQNMVHTCFFFTVRPYIDGDESYYVKAKLGTTIFLPCRAYGSPTPNRKWTKDKATTQVSRGAQTVDGLIITSAQLKDSGVYHCKAESGLGMAEKIVTVDIYGTNS